MQKSATAGETLTSHLHVRPADLGRPKAIALTGFGGSYQNLPMRSHSAPNQKLEFVKRACPPWTKSCKVSPIWVLIPTMLWCCSEELY